MPIKIHWTHNKRSTWPLLSGFCQSSPSDSVSPLLRILSGFCQRILSVLSFPFACLSLLLAPVIFNQLTLSLPPPLLSSSLIGRYRNDHRGFILYVLMYCAAGLYAHSSNIYKVFENQATYTSILS
jgi:hypothetical protein